jgi:hypothetical protein
MPLPKLFELERLASDVAEGIERNAPSSGRANPKAKAATPKVPAFSTMTPSPHYAGLHPGLTYMFGRAGSGEVIRLDKATKSGRSEEAVDEEDNINSANEFDSLMGWANDGAGGEEEDEEPPLSTYTKPQLSIAELPSSPARNESKVPGSPARGSPSTGESGHGGARGSPSKSPKPSPLQTIVEEKPDVEPPECLKTSEEKAEKEA